MNKIDLNGREWIEKGKVISVYLNISAEGITPSGKFIVSE